MEQNCGNNLGFSGQLALYIAENTNLLPIRLMATNLLYENAGALGKQQMSA
jgi:hypothetical protein